MKSDELYICDFKGYGKFVVENEISGRIEYHFQEGLYAQFYTDENPFMLQPYDYYLITPTKPLVVNNFDKLYDNILDRMKFHTNNGLTSFTHKKDFLHIFVRPQIEFEECTPIVKKFTDEYMNKHPQFKFARIYSKYVYDPLSPETISSDQLIDLSGK